MTTDLPSLDDEGGNSRRKFIGTAAAGAAGLWAAPQVMSAANASTAGSPAPTTDGIFVTWDSPCGDTIHSDLNPHGIVPTESSTWVWGACIGEPVSGVPVRFQWDNGAGLSSAYPVVPTTDPSGCVTLPTGSNCPCDPDGTWTLSATRLDTNAELGTVTAETLINCGGPA